MIRKRISKVVLIVMVSGCLFFILLLFCLYFSQFSNAQTRFRQVTGLDLPKSASVIRQWHSEFGPFCSDGFRCMVVSVPQETIREWLATPLISRPQWKKGPVLEGVFRDPTAIPDETLNSLGVYYSFYDDNTSSSNLIIIDITKQQVWFLEVWY